MRAVPAEASTREEVLLPRPEQGSTGNDPAAQSLATTIENNVEEEEEEEVRRHHRGHRRKTIVVHLVATTTIEIAEGTTTTSAATTAGTTTTLLAECAKETTTTMALRTHLHVVTTTIIETTDTIVGDHHRLDPTIATIRDRPPTIEDRRRDRPTITATILGMIAHRRLGTIARCLLGPTIAPSTTIACHLLRGNRSTHLLLVAISSFRTTSSQQVLWNQPYTMRKDTFSTRLPTITARDPAIDRAWRHPDTSSSI